MQRYDYDLFTIGAGSGGVAASRRAGALGARVAICETWKVGGTCVLRGCVPKKLMVYASSLREEFADAPAWGWRCDAVAVDWSKLVSAKDAELERLNGIYENMLRAANVEVIRGRGRVIDPHTVEVDGRRYTAQRILLATGGWPHVPTIPGAEHAMTSNEALDLRVPPAALAIVGGGYIAVEFAGIFSGAGSKVTQIVRGPALLRGFDEDVQRTLGEAIAQRGINVRYGRQVVRIDKLATGRLNLELDDSSVCEVDAVLYATGRRPASENLGLEEVGVARDSAGAVVVDRWSRTQVPSIWAVGDVTGRAALTPVAIADGRAFVETEFKGNPTAVDHREIPTAVFSQPPVGTVGLTEAEARAQKGDGVDIYVSKFRPMKYVIPNRDSRSMMKLVVDRETQVVLGVHMVGLDAPEVLQGFAVALRCGATKQQFDATVGIHPSSAEEFVTMTTPVAARTP